MIQVSIMISPEFDTSSVIFPAPAEDDRIVAESIDSAPGNQRVRLSCAMYRFSGDPNPDVSRIRVPAPSSNSYSATSPSSKRPPSGGGASGSGVGIGAGVAVGDGVGLGAGVSDGPGVAVAVGVGDGPGVAVEVGVETGVGAGVGVGVRLGHGFGRTGDCWYVNTRSVMKPTEPVVLVVRSATMYSRSGTSYTCVTGPGPVISGRKVAPS